MHSKFAVSILVKEKRVLLRGYLCKANFFGKPRLISSNTADFFPAHSFTFLCHLPSFSCSVSLWSIALKFPKSNGFFLESRSLLQAALSSVSSRPGCSSQKCRHNIVESIACFLPCCLPTEASQYRCGAALEICQSKWTETLIICPHCTTDLGVERNPGLILLPLALH